jgi:hypothetical protein
MKKYRRTIPILGFLFIFFTILPNLAVKAQSGVGPGDPDADVPIDGGISLLVAAGIGYGIKKNKERKSSNKDIEM